MSEPTQVLSRLERIFDDVLVDEVLVLASGEVYGSSPSHRRPFDLSLDSGTVRALANQIASHAHADGASSEGVVEVVLNSVLWSVVGPPLTLAPTLLGHRIPRRRRSLGDLVERELMTSEQAQEFVDAVRGGRNILISSYEHTNAVVLLDAVLELLPPGQLAVFLGDVRLVDRQELDVVFVDNNRLPRVSDDGGRALLATLRRARWALMDRVATPEDVHWWFAGECFARGRIGAISAFDPASAALQLHALHKARFGHEVAIDTLVDTIIFVEHLRPGKAGAVRIDHLSPMDGAQGAFSESGLRVPPTHDSGAWSVAPASTGSSLLQPPRGGGSGFITAPRLSPGRSALRDPPTSEAAALHTGPSSPAALRSPPPVSSSAARDRGHEAAPVATDAHMDLSLSAAVSSAFDDVDGDHDDVFSFDLDSVDLEVSEDDGAPELFDADEFADLEMEEAPDERRTDARRPRAGASRYNAATTLNDAESIRARKHRRGSQRDEEVGKRTGVAAPIRDSVMPGRGEPIATQEMRAVAESFPPGKGSGLADESTRHVAWSADYPGRPKGSG